MSLSARHSGKHSNATVVYSGDPAVMTPIDAAGANQGIELDDTRYLEWSNFDIYAAASENVRVWAQDATTKILHNRIHGARNTTGFGNGIMGWGSFTLAYNLLYANGANGVYVRGTDTNPEIYNNVFYGNQEYGLALEDIPGINATVSNNIASGNVLGGFWRGTLGTVSDSHNCVPTGPAGNPKFVSPSNGDFHLQAGSPCIDSGIDVNQFADFAGNPLNDEPSVPNTGSPGQYSRNFVDIGAVEVQPCDISACTNGGGGCH